MKGIAIITLAAATLLSASAAMAAPPATHWATRNMTFDMNTCLVKAQNAHERAGSSSIVMGSTGVRGYKGDYVGIMICKPGKDMLIVYTAGPSASRTKLYRNALLGGF